MNDENKAKAESEETEFSRQVGSQAARKRKAQRGPDRSIWFGLGMSGLIGWSVAVPTLIGAALGIWLDTHYPSSLSRTLMLLLVGLIIGCFTAWRWVASEYEEMQGDPDE